MADAVVFLASERARFITGVGLAGRRRNGDVTRCRPTEKPVVVYGASGYTGRLICEYLREFNVPFIAAGRDKELLHDVVDKIPGIETVEYEVVEVEHTVEALTELFTRRRRSSATPSVRSSSFGDEVAEACLAAGCHYLDTTGEQDWVLHAQKTVGQEVRRRRACCSRPGIAQMYTTGEIAANIALETPGLDTLDILVLWKGFPTYASTQTIFTILKADWFHLDENQYVKWDAAPPPSRSSSPVSTSLRSPCPGAAPATRCGSRTTRGWRTAEPSAACSTGQVMEAVVATTKIVEKRDQDAARDGAGAGAGRDRRAVAGRHAATGERPD